MVCESPQKAATIVVLFLIEWGSTVHNSHSQTVWTVQRPSNAPYKIGCSLGESVGKRMLNSIECGGITNLQCH